MKTNKWHLAALLFFLAAGLGAAPQLKPIHPDEAVQDTLQGRFALDNALVGVRSMASFLDSFRRLTEVARGKLPALELKAVGHTDWETQQLAFTNLPQTVEGALRYQNWQLKKTRHRLAALEQKTGQCTAQQAELARSEAAQAEKEFQEFWNSLQLAD